MHPTAPKALALALLAAAAAAAAGGAAGVAPIHEEIAGERIRADVLRPGQAAVQYQGYFFNWAPPAPLTYAMTSAGAASPAPAEVVVLVCRPWARCVTETTPAAALGRVTVDVWCCSLDPTFVRVSFRAGPAPVAYVAVAGPLSATLELCPPGPPTGLTDLCAR